MAAPRKWTPEQCADVVLRHVRGETTHAIAAAHGRNQSTVARLLKAPDIIALIAEEDAKIVAVEQSQADTLRDAKKREQSKESSARHRERKAVEKVEADRAESVGRAPRSRSGKSDPDAGRIIGAVTFDSRTGNVIRTAGFGGAQSDDWTEEEWRNEPREVIGRASIQLAACTFTFEPGRRDDCERVARLVATEPEVEFVPFEELVTALAGVEPGRVFTVTVDDAPLYPAPVAP